MSMVYVVMGNDYPATVFDNEAAAEAYCEAQKQTPEALEQKRRYGRPSIYWRSYPFKVRTA